MNWPLTRPTRTAPIGPANGMSETVKRGRGAVDRENVGIVLAIRAEQDRNDLRVVKITGREERPERPIRHARSERFLFGRAAFAFEIAAGKFPDRRRFFAVIDREREPILPFLDLGGGDRADEDHGVAAWRR